MRFHFTHPMWLAALPAAIAWVVYLSMRTHVMLPGWRRYAAGGLRLACVTAVVLALAGLQWLHPQEGMNVVFLLDRSDSVPYAQQEWGRDLANQLARGKPASDRAGLVVFGAEAALEASARPAFQTEKIQAVVPTDRTDLGAAIRLGTAAFPETGQKRLVLLSDGNENLGDGLGALLAAAPLGVTLDAIPLGGQRRGDAALQRIAMPGQLRKNQTFEIKTFIVSDRARAAALRFFRDDRFLGEQTVQLQAGKNLFALPQTLSEPGFYRYDVQLDAAEDAVPLNNRAIGFAMVRGDPRLLLVTADAALDAPLAAALRQGRLEVRMAGPNELPETLAELQSFDAILLSNVAAGDLGREGMLLLESAVRDFGVGLVCLGGDQAFTAGGYRGTPLESALPVSMELDSRKVLPNGALVLVVHATEFPNGNQWARDIAYAALEALGPQDEMGIVLWDGLTRWLYPLEKVGDKKRMRAMITGMMPGDMPDFQPVIQIAFDALRSSSANLKHMVVFSDGDPGAPTEALVQGIVENRITISSVMIGGHVKPDTMLWMAERGRGRFYEVNAPAELPQIFLKEAAVILKAAIFEEPFRPQTAAPSEITRGFDPSAYPVLEGHVATTPKPRAEMPLVSAKGDPLLAHWQYGLGRAVAFTSDARAKWAAAWLSWPRYQQFWSQAVQWSLRRLENAAFSAEIVVDKGEGHLSVEAVDEQGNFRNFLDLQAVVVGPGGARQSVRVEQTGPGRYEARFAARQVGSYLANLMEVRDGAIQATQVLGASVNYSPEFDTAEANLGLLRRLAEAGGGKVLGGRNPDENPFQRGRQRTFQPWDLWEWLLKAAVILFPVDVAIRRVQIDLDEWRRAGERLLRWLLFWRKGFEKARPDESLAALLARRDRVRSSTIARPGDRPGDARPAPEPQETVRTESTAPPPSAAAPAGSAGSLEAQMPVQPAAPIHPAASTASRLLEAKRRAQERSRRDRSD